MKAYRDRRDGERKSIQEKYSIIGFISSGTYGKVYKAQTRNTSSTTLTSRMVAIKKFKPGKHSIIIIIINKNKN
jgi:cyclin-dependent kinase 8/11